MKLPIHDRFNQELPADTDLSNSIRQVHNACFSYVQPTVPVHPKLVHVANDFAAEIGLSPSEIESEDFLAVFSGQNVYSNTHPYAMNYGGHQFGNWAGQLGDGRAINLFEIELKNQFLTLQLKGAGKTPYSRRGDGLAVLRSSIREHLCSEAMHYLGVPTSRSLAVIETGNEVLRDVMYDGNPEYERGAIVTRSAPSFIRFGSFEILAARNETDNLRLLADYTIQHFFPEITATGKEKYLAFFRSVANKTRELMVHWQRVGFVHGVMNTDNLSIHGITIDYGPYGWLEDYNPNWTPNTTDNEYKRYAFGNQPDIALWNLYQLANALYPLIEETTDLEAILNDYGVQFDVDYLTMMRSKLGLQLAWDEDKKLISELELVLQLSETDMTIFFRELSKIGKDDSEEIMMSRVNNAFYNSDDVANELIQKQWTNWFTNYKNRLQKEEQSDADRKESMNQVNPKYVLRNYMAQLAIDAANTDDYSVIDELYQLLKKPYDEQPEQEKWFAKRPDWARKKIGCSMLSCSS
jgi:serine/tyrosine/threonine adenylyltransferase